VRIAKLLSVVAASIAVAVGWSAAADGQQPPVYEGGGATPLSSDVQHLHFKYGPIHIVPGQNLILLGPVTIEKPAYDGYVTRIKPNLVRADGSVPPVDQVHLHHGVFINNSRRDSTSSGAERFFATGEEKTIYALPPGYGYFVRGTDVWAMNYMIHNQTPNPDDVWITYDIDYVPARSALARTIKPVRPIWLDVMNGQAYPVFDVHRGAGGATGKFTFPNGARNAYAGKAARNVWTADRSGTLVAAAGHLHPGGLWDDVTLERPSRASLPRRRGSTPRTSVPILHSVAKYFDPAGPVSWDMAMTRSKQGWRVPIRKGDRLRVTATYDTERASWYESMGIVLAYMADGTAGRDPFVHPPDRNGPTTHGPLPENRNHGGEATGAPDPTKLADGQTLGSRVGVQGFVYLPGDLGLPGQFGLPPVVKPGQSLTFDNEDASAQIFHTITACRAPCNRATGISYPLADGPVSFDSGQLGYGPPGFTAAANRYEWTTPPNLKAGTYTYFCRVHPYMRGAFRVKP
jgi:plastocyanin